MKNIICLLMCLVTLSCEGNDSSERVKYSKNSKPVGVDASGQPYVPGEEWTLSEFSDTFDEGLTIRELEETFGTPSYVSEEEGITEVVYEIESSKRYDRGVRLYKVTVFFKDDKVFNVEMGFTAIGDY